MIASIANGSAFDPNRQFSLRIWQVPEAREDKIFYAMNMEPDKADASQPQAKAAA
jgi:hypothetical protein